MYLMQSFRYTCLGLCAVVAMGATACAAQVPQHPLSSAERIELDTLKAQLSDPARAPKTKREAALLLLTRSYPQATIALREFLTDATNRPAQIAIAEAIGESGQTGQDFVKPLLAMLGGEEPSVRAPAANALAAYKETEVLDALAAMALSDKTDRDTRLAIIAAMQRILDKKAVDTLVQLLDDGDETIGNAAADALGKLTSIRAFQRDRSRWKSWWAQNKDKPRSAWLADLADSLGRSALELERQNAELRRRLCEAMDALYAAAAPARKDALLGEMLKDPLAEIRLTGARLARERVTASRPLPEALGTQVRALVADEDPAVRRAAALLTADLRDAQAVKLLAGRLEVEQAGEVREALYQALGLLRDPSVWDQLVAGLGESEQRVAAAAAAALAHVAENNAAEEARRDRAVEALKSHFALGSGDGSAGLREAMLAAMGAMKDKRLAPLMSEALKDPAATVRLSAVKGLQQLGLAESVAPVAALAGSDPDRGVRLAAIVALGALGGPEQVETLLASTDARSERDPAVRQQAWTVIMSLLPKADTPSLAALADQLQPRPDAAEQLISVLKLWAERIPPEEPEQWVPIRLRLGEALLARDRPAEAAGEFAKAHEALAKAGNPEAAKVHLRWIQALLAADEASAAGKIAEIEDEARFAAALAALEERLEALKAGQDWDALVRLTATARERLAKRLSEAQLQRLQAVLEQAREQQRSADRQRVSGLVARLVGSDEAARAAAGKELADMKDRAVGPLVAELRRELSTETPSAEAEKLIAGLIANLAPQLAGYDAQAPQAERIKVVDGWLKQLGS